MSASSTTPRDGERRNGGKPFHWLPFLLFSLFLLCFCYCLWLLWEQYAALAENAADEKSQEELLLAQKKELEELLKLPPCEARKRVALLPGTSGAEKSPDLPITPVTPENSEQAPARPQSQSALQLPDKIESACVFLVSLAGANKLSTGSGFFIAPGYIATNRHVVGANPGRILVTSKALGQPVAGKVVARSAGKGEDFAIVAVTPPEDAKISHLKLVTDPKKTQKVGAWGFPNIIGKNDPAYASLLKGENLRAVPELSYSEGVISAVLDRNPKIIVHTAPISPGNSGGPLLDEKGDVVGINTMITLDEDSYRQASIALSAEDLARFIKANGISTGQ